MTDFFKTSSIASVKSASAHIDEKYGIDVDDIYRIDDILPEEVRARYNVELTPSDEAHQDQIHLGYYKLDKL